MQNKNVFLREVESALLRGKGSVIEEEYIEVVLDTLKELANEDSSSMNVLEDIKNIIIAVVERSLATADQTKVASMLMARLSCAKHLTIAHTNIVLTTIGLTFKQGNQIMYNVSKYNSHINSICLEQMNTLSQLSNNRIQAVNNEDRKQDDINNVSAIIKQQFSAL